jgi:hypothetical protein
MHCSSFLSQKRVLTSCCLAMDYSITNVDDDDDEDDDDGSDDHINNNK